MQGIKIGDVLLCKGEEWHQMQGDVKKKRVSESQSKSNIPYFLCCRISRQSRQIQL